MQKPLSILFAMLACAASFAWAGATGAVVEDDYARPHTRVDVGDGRQLNLFCAGSGSPTVVFDAGIGSAGWDWLRVHPAIARQTRACVYDRAGFGFSDAPHRAGTSANAVSDLHALLGAAGIAPPYLLVGHSYGGRNVQLFAYTYPREVVGMVIVDSAHEDDVARMDRVTGGLFSKMHDAEMAGFEGCVAAAKGGFLAGSAAFAECTGGSTEGYGRALSGEVIRMSLRPSYWSAAESESVNFSSVSADQLRAARQPFGNLPLIYLTHGISPYQVPGKPQTAMNKASERETANMHREIAALSTQGKDRIVAGAGHAIHMDRPAAVIEAIDEVLAETRAPRR
ncbi:pimeloyl-ACP methyl ester carboxylesterase [Actimicrobium sp. GrIS 1.19]|uniref:alpha/beta fold hydrolase n=1 Tax=Actimicrobium sp. GrIS 1.19 TaxID=3071708 RepID=UPI002E07E015|nr:pimeloyl-ACP methyl ester carboxylesterase [Actimicrobium sp. GrIS 1.19]